YRSLAADIGREHANADAREWPEAVFTPGRDFPDGLLRFRPAMRQHRRHRAPGNQLLEVADVPVGLYGGTGVALRVPNLSGRETAGVRWVGKLTAYPNWIRVVKLASTGHNKSRNKLAKAE